MSAVGLLANPALFAGAPAPPREPVDLAREYLSFADRYTTHFRMVRPHIFQLLYAPLRHRPDLLAALAKTKQTEAGAVASFSPFLDRVEREVGTLAQARAEQQRLREQEERAAGAGGAGEGEDGVSVTVDGRKLGRSEYKVLLRKQRTYIYMCVYVCIYVCMYIYIYIFTIYTFIYTFVYIYIYK